jgi:ABC-type uncharacterized transport system permease subunit
MAECTYTAGNQLLSDLGKGNALLSMYVGCAATGDTITTSFIDCHPVATYAHTSAAIAADDDMALAEAGGLITLYFDANTATHAFVMIHGRKF